MYLDSNIFIYAFIDNTEQGDLARNFMEKLVGGEVKAYVSPLVLDEVVWVIHKLKGKELASRVGKTILSMPLIWLDVTYESAKHSLDFYGMGLKPRDALHLGIMRDYDLTEILSEDGDFNGIKGIERRSLRNVV